MPLPQLEIRGWTSALSAYSLDEYVDCPPTFYLDDETELIGPRSFAAECTWLAIIHRGEPAIIFTPTHIYVIPPENVDSPSVVDVLNRYLPADLRVTFYGPGAYEMVPPSCEWFPRSGTRWSNPSRGRVHFGNGVRLIRIERSS